MNRRLGWFAKTTLALLAAGFVSAGVSFGQEESKPQKADPPQKKAARAITVTDTKVAPAIISKELRDGVRLEAAGKPIDTKIGHAAPLLADFDGDGKLDLLVGQFGGGTCAFYKNMGTNEAPKYASGVNIKAGGKDCSVPTG